MDKYVYIIIRSRRGGLIRGIGGESKEIIKIVNSYPIIGELLGQLYKPITKKAILTRMGKGKGKIITYSKPLFKGSIIFEGFIPKAKFKYILYRMKKEGVFNSSSNMKVLLYEKI